MKFSQDLACRLDLTWSCFQGSRWPRGHPGKGSRAYAGHMVIARPHRRSHSHVSWQLARSQLDHRTNVEEGGVAGRRGKRVACDAWIVTPTHIFHPAEPGGQQGTQGFSKIWLKNHRRACRCRRLETPHRRAATMQALLYRGQHHPQVRLPRRTTPSNSGSGPGRTSPQVKGDQELSQCPSGTSVPFMVLKDFHLVLIFLYSFKNPLLTLA